MFNLKKKLSGKKHDFGLNSRGFHINLPVILMT